MEIRNLSRTCGYCGVEFTRNVGEKITRFDIREWCSRKCFHLSRVPLLKPHAPCANELCGGPVVRREGEQVTRYNERRCCSPECSRELSLKGVRRHFARLRGDPETGWPEITGSNLEGTPFAKHDHDPGDGGPMRLPLTMTHVSSDANS